MVAGVIFSWSFVLQGARHHARSNKIVVPICPIVFLHETTKKYIYICGNNMGQTVYFYFIKERINYLHHAMIINLSSSNCKRLTALMPNKTVSVVKRIGLIVCTANVNCGIVRKYLLLVNILVTCSHTAIHTRCVYVIWLCVIGRGVYFSFYDSRREMQLAIRADAECKERKLSARG